MANCIYKYNGKDYTKEEFYSLVSSSNFIQQEQTKKFAELQERLNNKEFLEGAKNAFESSEELQNVYYEALGFEIPTTKLKGKKFYYGEPTFFDIATELTSGERSKLPSSILINKLLQGEFLPTIKDSQIILGLSEAGIWKPNLKKIEASGENKSTLAKKVGHELLHSVTNNIILSYQNLKGVIDFNDKYFKDFIRQGYIKPIELTKSQIEALDNLVRIRNKVVAYIEQNKDKIQKEDRGFGTYDYFIRTNYTESETDLHEFISEVFTNPELINILKEIPTEGKKSNLFKDFVDAIAKILGFTNTSILEDIIAYSEEAFFAQPQITPQQKQDALNAYTDYIARISLGIIKNPSSGEYNYTSKVRDIVYHGTLSEEIFDKFTIGKSKEFDYSHNSIFATSSIEDAKTGGTGGINEDRKFNVLPLLLNIEEDKLGLLKEGYITQKSTDTFNLPKNDLDSIIKNSEKHWKEIGWEYKRISDTELFIKKPDRNLLRIGVWKNNKLIIDLSDNMGYLGDIKESQVNILKENGISGVIIENAEKLGLTEKNKKWYIVFEPEQIHVMGGKNDIQGFKDFVQGKQVKEQTDNIYLHEDYLNNSNILNAPFIPPTHNQLNLLKQLDNKSVKEVLEFVISNTQREDLKYVAEVYLKNVNKIHFVKFKSTPISGLKGGHYDAGKAEILFNPLIALTDTQIIERSGFEKALGVILHEFSHTFTIDALFKPKNKEEVEFKNFITEQFKYYKQITPFKDNYGFKNEREFISEILTNRDFRSDLYYRENKKEIKNNYLKNILDKILKFLGFKTNNVKEESPVEIINTILSFVNDYSKPNEYTKSGIIANNIEFQKLTAEEKARTIEQITKEQNNSLFGLNTQNQEQLEFHINTLNVVSKFLENVGIEQRLIPEFLSQDGNVVEGAIAAANFIDGTVDIIDDLEKGRTEAWNKLPEEAAHWWYRLLDTNSELKDALLMSGLTDRKEEELRNSLYGDVYKGPKVVGKLALDSQGNITQKPALSPIREEAIGQLIAEAIKRIETKNANASDYSFFKKFLEWINSIIDIFKDTTQDPFEVAAMKILSSDMSDLMTWEEYRKLNNIVNFANVVTEQSVAPIDYTLIEDLGRFRIEPIPVRSERGITITEPRFTWYSSDRINKKDSPNFTSQEELDLWVFQNYGNLLEQRQKQRIQEVRDNQIFFDRLLNKSFRKKSKFLPKTLRKYFEIIDAQNLNPLREWNISQELQQITKKLSEQEKKQIIETNGYTNIAPTLKVLPDLLQKYRKNPIVLSEPIKIDGAKKQELSILNGIREMIKLENPNLKSITAEEFVAEAHNWLETNYLLGFANEKSYLSYRTDQTFTYLKDRVSDEDFQLGNMTEEEIQRLPFEERQRIANIVGLTKQNPDVYHNKVSLRFNDMYHLKSGHFDKSPSAWGNLTYFYTGKNKWKDAVLLHEIQNDNIEFLREFTAEKVDLETSLGRYLQQLNVDLLDNITQIESGNKKIVRKDSSIENQKTHIQLNYQLQQLKDLPLEQGLQQLKQRLSELIELYKSDSSKDVNRAQEAVDRAYSQRRKFQDFQRRGGIKSLLTKEELQNLEELLKRLNTEEVETATWSAEDNAHFLDLGVRDLKQKKQDFNAKTIELQARITRELQKMYGDNAPLINLTAPTKPRTKNQIRQGVQRSQELNENVNWLLAYSEKKILNELSKTIEESKKNYIQARNATVAYNFNVQLSKITLEQWGNLVENYKYNEDLLERLIDEQAQKDINSSELQKQSKAKSIISYLGDNPSVKLGKGKYGFMWDTANTEKGIVAVWDAYKNANTSEDSYIDNWSVDEFLKYVKEIAPEYLSLDTKSIDKEKQQTKFETLKQKALDKKAELEKNYGKIEEEVKQTLEIEMNYFTPLVHHLIQKHINQYGKDFPMYFSGYQITKLTQGNDRTALIYAGKDEINIVDKNSFKVNDKKYQRLGEGAIINADSKEELRYFKLRDEYKLEDINGIRNITEQEYNKALQEYEKAYQQATERRAKEIKVIAAQQLGLFPTASVEKLSTEKLEEGIKALNEFKKIPKNDPRSKHSYKSNSDIVIETIMQINNNKPIETGAIYNAMSQISGIKLVWQNNIPGLKSNTYTGVTERDLMEDLRDGGITREEYEQELKKLSGGTGGYLVDLNNYNYNTPVLYGLQNPKKQQNNNNAPDVILPIGTSGSGKSNWIKSLPNQENLEETDNFDLGLNLDNITKDDLKCK